MNNSLKIKNKITNTLRIVKDEKGKIISKQLFDPNNILIEKIKPNGNICKLVYGKTGNMIYMDTYNPIDKKVSRQFYRYDIYGNTIYTTNRLSLYKSKIEKLKLDKNIIKYTIKGVFDYDIKYDNDHNILALKSLYDKFIQWNKYENGLIRLSKNNRGLKERYDYNNNHIIKFTRKLKDQTYIERYKYDKQGRAICCETSTGRKELVEYLDWDKNIID